MRVLFVIDKVEYKYFEFNNLVTNFWLIKELAVRNSVWITTIDKLSIADSVAYAICNEVVLFEEDMEYIKEDRQFCIDDFELVFFRPDPPVDNNYINATYIFDFVKQAKVINSPFAIRNFNEKMHALMFRKYMPASLVSASLSEIEQFLSENDEIILKPLDKCFGAGVFYLKNGDKNTRSLIKSMTNNEVSQIMVQKYLPGVAGGDKRVLTLGAELLDYSIVKHPTGDDFKFNTHSGEYITKGFLTEKEKQDFTNVAQKLNSMGIYLAGLDVIDGKIIEINVTSPCYFIKEINEFFGVQLEKELCEFFVNKNSCYKVENIV